MPLYRIEDRCLDVRNVILQRTKMEIFALTQFSIDCLNTCSSSYSKPDVVTDSPYEFGRNTFRAINLVIVNGYFDSSHILVLRMGSNRKSLRTILFISENGL